MATTTKQDTAATKAVDKPGKNADTSTNPEGGNGGGSESKAAEAEANDPNRMPHYRYNVYRDGVELGQVELTADSSESAKERGKADFGIADDDTGVITVTRAD